MKEAQQSIYELKIMFHCYVIPHMSIPLQPLNTTGQLCFINDIFFVQRQQCRRLYPLRAQSIRGLLISEIVSLVEIRNP